MPLLLLPNLLSQTQKSAEVLPLEVAHAVKSLQGLFAESDKGGRTFLRHFLPVQEALKVPIALINEHTSPQDFPFYLEPLIKGETWGLVSDCGLPVIADPGSGLILEAHRKGIAVSARGIPSSILLALLLSGLPAQRFSFQGYVEREAEGRTEQLRAWEKRSHKEQETIVFMETPYRNETTLEALFNSLSDTTLLSLAIHLGSPEEKVITTTVGRWKRIEKPTVDKVPVVFVFCAQR